MPQGNTRHRRISCAASSGQRTGISMREAFSSTTSAQHGTDGTHNMQHTTGAAACSDHTRSRHPAGIETYEMRRSRLRRALRYERHGRTRSAPSRVFPGVDSSGQLAVAACERWRRSDGKLGRARCGVRWRRRQSAVRHLRPDKQTYGTTRRWARRTGAGVRRSPPRRYGGAWNDQGFARPSPSASRDSSFEISQLV